MTLHNHQYQHNQEMQIASTWWYIINNSWVSTHFSPKSISHLKILRSEELHDASSTLNTHKHYASPLRTTWHSNAYCTNMVIYHQQQLGIHIFFPKIYKPPQNSKVRRATWCKFHTEHPQTLRITSAHNVTEQCILHQHGDISPLPTTSWANGTTEISSVTRCN